MENPWNFLLEISKFEISNFFFFFSFFFLIFEVLFKILEFSFH
jgi:hypothetical protein